MSSGRFTLVDDGHATEIEVSLADGVVRLDAPALRDALGWELTDEGLCRDGVCVGTPPGWSAAEGVDLARLAALLGRPLALDPHERIAWLGVGADDRARALRSLAAPDFALTDLEGRVHRLSDQRGKKVLLVVWASW